MFIISTKTISAKLNITKDLEEMSLQEYNKTWYKNVVGIEQISEDKFFEQISPEQIVLEHFLLVKQF
jgi:hypothetical protein